MTDATRAALLALVGTSYARLDCWDLVREALRVSLSVELPRDYYASLRFFKVVATPEPLDVLAIRNHPFVTNHCGIYIGDGRFLHTLENVGAHIARIDAAPWNHAGRIAGYLRLK
jgi:cell wall-associated NlpC family hydrolase